MGHNVLLILHFVWSLHLQSAIRRYFREIAFLTAPSGVNTGTARALFMADPPLASSSAFSLPSMFRCPGTQIKVTLWFSLKLVRLFLLCSTTLEVVVVASSAWIGLRLGYPKAILPLKEKSAISNLQASPIASTSAWKTLLVLGRRTDFSIPSL